jgi:hypothetical protein
MPLIYKLRAYCLALLPRILLLFFILYLFIQFRSGSVLLLSIEDTFYIISTKFYIAATSSFLSILESNISNDYECGLVGIDTARQVFISRSCMGARLKLIFAAAIISAPFIDLRYRLAALVLGLGLSVVLDIAKYASLAALLHSTGDIYYFNIDIHALYSDLSYILIWSLIFLFFRRSFANYGQF